MFLVYYLNSFNSSQYTLGSYWLNSSQIPHIAALFQYGFILYPFVLYHLYYFSLCLSFLHLCCFMHFFFFLKKLIEEKITYLWSHSHNYFYCSLVLSMDLNYSQVLFCLKLKDFNCFLYFFFFNFTFLIF